MHLPKTERPCSPQVAQEGLSGAGAATTADTSARMRTSGLGSYPEIHVPVYAAVKGVSSSGLPLSACQEQFCKIGRAHV